MKPSLRRERKKAWDAFRKFIYRRDGDKCVTCGRECSGSGRHAGHFLTGATCSPSLYFLSTNCHVQCYSCNIHKSGNWPEYEAFMLRRYGHEHVEWMKKERRLRMGEKWEIKDYQRIIEIYKGVDNLD